MTTFQPHATDAERAAAWAAEALREGRYDLGHALARIAATAWRVQASADAAAAAVVAVAPVEQPRHLQAVPDNHTWQQAVDAFAANDTRNTPQPPVVPYSVAESRDYFATDVVVGNGPDVPAPPVPPATRKCRVQVMRDGVADMCGLIAYWSMDHEEWRHVHGDGPDGAGHKPVVLEAQ